MSVRFAIDGRAGTIQVQGRDLGLLEQASPKIRALIDGREHPTDIITLSPSEDDDIDIESIRYILENIGSEEQLRIQGPGPETLSPLEIVDLSRQCNALYFYDVHIQHFSGLWSRLPNPWDIISLPKGVWSWRIPRRKDIHRDAWGSYANAAWMLEKDTEFSDVIGSLVFDTKCDSILTAVPCLKDLKKYRERYMENLFHELAGCIKALSPDIAQKVQNRIEHCRNLDLHLLEEMDHRLRAVIRPWAKSKEHLLGRTIYGFALQVDMALLEGTALEYKKEDYAAYASMPSGQPGPKSLNRPHFTSALRVLCGPSARYVEAVTGVLNIMNAQIARDRAQLRNELLSKRRQPPDRERTSPSQRTTPSERASPSERGTGSDSATSQEGGIISEAEFRTWQSWSRAQSSSAESGGSSGISQANGASSFAVSSFPNGSALRMHGALQSPLQFGSPRPSAQTLGELE